MRLDSICYSPGIRKEKASHYSIYEIGQILCWSLSINFQEYLLPNSTIIQIPTQMSYQEASADSEVRVRLSLLLGP
jgi:hypothetical protein